MFKDIFKNNNYTIIVGCGKLGADLATKLYENNEDVLIIDNNEDAFKKLPTNFGGLTLVSNGTDIDTLVNAKIKKATSVIAVTNDDNVNIMVSLLARELFGIKKVVARLYNSDKKIIYEDFKIETICPTLLLSDLITKKIYDNQTEEKN